VFIINSFDQIWQFNSERNFLCIHLMYDNEKGVVNYTNEDILSLNVGIY